MDRNWIHMALLTAILLMLAGCGKTIEEQVSTGIASAETKFEAKPLLANTEIDNVSLYLPSGFSIANGETESNYLVQNGKDQYIFFVNPFEQADSQLHYQLLKDDETKKILQDKTFEQDGLFGFSAVTEYDKGQFEIIVSIGGKKMTTISTEKNVDAKITSMMEIIRSASLKK